MRIRVLAVIAALAIGSFLVVGAIFAPPIAAPTAAFAAEPDTTEVAPPDGAGIGDLDGVSTSPSPRGQPAPPRAQRVADTVIFVGLLVVFVAGVAIAVRSGRRTGPPA